MKIYSEGLRDVARDLAATSTYIYIEYLNKPLFFQDIDKAMDLAEKFMEKYPTGTDWEKTEDTWEGTLFKFIKENEAKQMFRVYAEVSSRCYIDVDATTEEEALAKAEDIDGGEFISDEQSGVWDIYKATKL